MSVRYIHSVVDILLTFFLVIADGADSTVTPKKSSASTKASVTPRKRNKAIDTDDDDDMSEVRALKKQRKTPTKKASKVKVIEEQPDEDEA